MHPVMSFFGHGETVFLGAGSSQAPGQAICIDGMHDDGTETGTCVKNPCPAGFHDNGAGECKADAGSEHVLIGKICAPGFSYVPSMSEPPGWAAPHSGCVKSSSPGFDLSPVDPWTGLPLSPTGNGSNDASGPCTMDNGCAGYKILNSTTCVQLDPTCQGTVTEDAPPKKSPWPLIIGIGLLAGGVWVVAGHHY